MDDIKILTPQMKYYYKNKDKINQKYCEKYRNNEEFKNYMDEKIKNSYQKNKKDYIKKNIIRCNERYKTDEEYRQKKLDYAKKYRELQKLKKLN
jgi:hypothetical protein